MTPACPRCGAFGAAPCTATQDWPALALRRGDPLPAWHPGRPTPAAHCAPPVWFVTTPSPVVEALFAQEHSVRQLVAGLLHTQAEHGMLAVSIASVVGALAPSIARLDRAREVLRAQAKERVA